MDTIENIEQAVDRLITVVNGQLEALQEIKLLLSSEALKGINIKGKLDFNEINKNNSQLKFKNADYKDYPFESKFPDKMNFLDKIHAKAWRLPERRDLIIKIEGEERASKTLDGITGKLQNLRKSGKWVAAKYGSVNKFTFYVKPEWLSEDGTYIKPEHAPDMEILKLLTEEKRRPENIVWLKN